MDNTKIVKIGAVGHGKIIIVGTMNHVIEYEEAKNNLKFLVPGIADKLINIVDAESYDIERKIAFLQTTVEEISRGADYSECESIEDMSHVYSRSIIERLF